MMDQQENSNATKKTTLLSNYSIHQIPLLGSVWQNLRFYRSTERHLQEIRQKQDKSDLESVNPPISEELTWHCSWFSEVYTPSELSKLFESLDKLGWLDDEKTYRITTVKDWLNQVRQNGGRRTWLNGGLIVRKDDERFPTIHRTKYANLPTGVNFARLSLNAISSSLVIVTIQFIFDETVSNSLIRSLQNTHQTTVEYIWSGSKISRASFTSPKQHRALQVQESITNVHVKLEKWFRDHLPGYFTNA
ncbi:MAG: hypothetical protein AAFR81_21945, partial [Chloroflexota bacterium]